MTATIKAIHVIASAGQGSSAAVPQGLSDYCAALASAAPTGAVRTEERGQDLAQLHIAASVKSTQVDPANYGVAIQWSPTAFHAEQEGSPGVWDSTANRRGVQYQATVNNLTYFVFVQMAP